MGEIGKYMGECYGVIATNRYLYNEAKKYNKRVYFIPNGLNLTEWDILPIYSGRFTVGFVGNISNPEYREFKGYHFIEASCKELGIPIRTALYGAEQIPHEEMRDKFYRHISCIVHPTISEGCSNTIMEALACGVPVITTRTAGYHGEELEDGKNVLFCERTTDSVKECIARLRQDHRLRAKLSIEGRKFAKTHHDINIVAGEYKKVIEGCFEHNKHWEERKTKENNLRVSVKALKPIYENNGNRNTGDTFVMAYSRAKQLVGLVEIIDKDIPAPAQDTMIRKEEDIAKPKPKSRPARKRKPTKRGVRTK
jgi:glycosyltransferase involved in cell wall biosynthesis